MKAFRKIMAKMHLWLGLSTGLVVFITGVTGAIYCFAPEWQKLQAYRHVQAEQRAFLAPTRVLQAAQAALPGKTPMRIYYASRSHAIMVWFSEKNVYDYSVFLNPYSGDILKVRDNRRDPLSIILQIHRNLGIPYGHDIIRWSTVIFVFMLISGLVLWWPRNKKFARREVAIMWRASKKRLVHDLHRIPGFYVLGVALVLALTGLMFAFKGFAEGIYQLTGSSASTISAQAPVSNSHAFSRTENDGLDRVWNQVSNEAGHAYASLLFVLPVNPESAILVRANPDVSTIYKTDFRYFDRYSGTEIPGAYVWGRYKDARVPADYIRRMNYDIHTGNLLGLPGRIMLFLVALIVASLPVTGFLFWWWRKRSRIK